jgi:predicted phosphohydrolase
MVEGEDDYSWMEKKFDNNSYDDDDEKVFVRQAKKTRVPEAVGGGTRLSHFNFDT